MTTYLLVHGAWHSGQAWERVAPLLTAAGHRVLAPTLTGHGSAPFDPEAGLETYVADVKRVLDEHDLADVVLVGHSYAGLIVSSVVNDVPERIGHVVYLDAMVPVHGETALDVMPITGVLVEAAARSNTPERVPPLPEMPAPHGLFGVTDPGDIARLRATLVDEPVRAYEQPVRLDNPVADAVPRTHIHCVGFEVEGITRRPVPPTQPNGSPAQVWELHSGHDCMITAPDELAALLLKLA
ncbi:alpha/beta fold hydrolase [Paractinoplanes brasiliensis]|uniref:Alpha/beta hydrolase family protein n=1 Tax=Paractinoplanes brasiliensis TaxID=52695 RepID=A0A4R6J7T0_9ACTN|nr:alpha/beta fold hydrolase [Actinoplanes brasiliensis]TDO31594.1 alpha/beta hydrolase family protein [Actinoplanes brasiliensis]GID30993.1 esterase [Actinoplanes brasiliensis]